MAEGHVLNKLLSISLEDISLEEMLGLVIENVIFLPWFELESKGGIFLVEEDPDVLVMKAQRGLSDQIQKMCARIPFGKCLCGRAAVSGTVEFADCMDERHDTRYRDMPPHGHYCVPIIFMGKVLGVIVLYIKEGHLRNEREEEFLLAVADVVAGIIRRKQSEKALLESEKRYFELSITDALTGLYNSRHYHNQLKSEIERTARYNRPLSLILMDIDDFKHYNDTYGHPEGDKVLARLGEVIRGCLRKTDSAYRYGGEEFTVILPETEGENAANAGERIRKRFESQVFSPGLGEKAHKTVSIGVAEYWPEEELSTFMKRTDKAMYSAKERGKNRVFFLKWDPDE